MKILVVTKDIKKSAEKIRTMRWDAEKWTNNSEAIFKRDNLSLRLKAIEVEDVIDKVDKCHLVLYDGGYKSEEIDKFKDHVICNDTLIKVMNIDRFMRNDNNMSLELTKNINKNLEALSMNHYTPVITEHKDSTMRVKCIDNSGNAPLTVGRIYTVTKPSERGDIGLFYWIKDDNGALNEYHSTRFELTGLDKMWSDFTERKVLIHCESEEDFNAFMDFAAAYARLDYSDYSVAYTEYTDNLCFEFSNSEGVRAWDMNSYISDTYYNDYQIITWKDFSCARRKDTMGSRLMVCINNEGCSAAEVGKVYKCVVANSEDFYNVFVDEEYVGYMRNNQFVKAEPQKYILWECVDFHSMVDLVKNKQFTCRVVFPALYQVSAKVVADESLRSILVDLQRGNYLYLDEVLMLLGDLFTTTEILEAINSGKWYVKIEEEC